MRGIDQGFGHFGLTPRVEPVADRRDGDGRGGFAVRAPDPGRERLRSLHQSDIAQLIAAAPRRLNFTEHRRHAGAISPKPYLIGRDDFSRVRRRQRGEDGDAGAADAERASRTDFDRQHLDRIGADPARDAERIEPGPHCQKQGIPELRGDPRQIGLGGDQQRRARLSRQCQFGHLPADDVTPALAAALDNAFLDQHVHDPVHGGPGQGGGLHDVRKPHALFAPLRENAQHRQRPPDRLGARSGLRNVPSRCHSPTRHVRNPRPAAVHHVDITIIIPSTAEEGWP